MRTLSLTLLALALACEAFAYWGLHTQAGRRSFDEMAGMVPLAVGAAGVPLALCALAVWWRSRRTERRERARR